MDLISLAIVIFCISDHQLSEWDEKHCKKVARQARFIKIDDLVFSVGHNEPVNLMERPCAVVCRFQEGFHQNSTCKIAMVAWLSDQVRFRLKTNRGFSREFTSTMGVSPDVFGLCIDQLNQPLDISQYCF